MTKINPYLLGMHVLGGIASPELTFDDDDLPELSEEELAAQAAHEIDDSINRQMTSTENSDGGRTVDGGGTPGAFPAAPARVLPSPLEGVPDDDWTRWVIAMRTGETSDIGDSGALGMFAFKLRRLADIGLMNNVAPTNARKTGRMSWTGDWVAPLTRDAFLNSPSIQYRALAASTQLYMNALADGEITQPTFADGDKAETEKEISLSGALALLHKCGPRGFEQWGNESKRQPSTVALFGATNGIF